MIIGEVFIVIIICVAVLSFFGYKICGIPGGSGTTGLFTMGIILFLIIADSAALDNISEKSFELLFILLTLLPPIIFNVVLFLKWIAKRYNERIKMKIQICEQQIKWLNEKMNMGHSVVELITLLKICDCDCREIECNKDFVDASKISKEIKNKKLEIKQLQYKLGNIKNTDMEKRI